MPDDPFIYPKGRLYFDGRFMGEVTIQEQIVVRGSTVYITDGADPVAVHRAIERCVLEWGECTLILDPKGGMVDGLVKPRDLGKTETKAGILTEMIETVNRWNDSDADPLADIEAMIAKIKGLPQPEKKATITVPLTDFSQLEMYMLAGMMHETSMDVQRRYHPIYDRVIEPIEKPVKQNGRSAEYLRHDRTKQHRRRR